MGLFSRSLEEKKLKKLTGGFLLNNQFKIALKNAGIDLNVGYDIQEILKNEIKIGKLGVDDIEKRLNFLIKQFSTINSKKELKKPLIVSSPKERTLKFLINQNHNVIPCPKCNSRLLKTDTFCFSCGFKLKTSADKKINPISKLDDLEKLYDEKIMHKNDNKLLFSYVSYLDDLNNNRKPEVLYGVNPSKLKHKAITKNHLMLNEAKQINGSELREKLTEDAVDFINKNRHILFYNNHPKLQSLISINMYVNVFENKNKSNVNRILETIIEFLNTMEYHALINYEIIRYKTILLMLIEIYEMKNDPRKSIELNFKIFILDLNNFSEKSKKANPRMSIINETIIDNLIFLLDNNSIDSFSLKGMFNKSYKHLEILNPVISAEESLIYFLKLFNGENRKDMEKSVRLRFI